MLISYAQNFEDVMLWRALGHVEDGFYIDIGAQDPLVDSVSLVFHEKGWRGIHVEPTVHYAGLLRQHRPGDTVIQAAVGDTAGVLPLFEIPGTGISTLDPTIAAQHRERGFDVHETTTPLVPLSTVLALAEGRDVHWMKIDVEGFEHQVLASWGDSALRPWVVVVESTLPLTQVQSHDRWEHLLIDKGYTFVYFDGLNRYYVSDRHVQLQAAFAVPPNVFDEFALNGTASATFHLFIRQRYEAQLAELRQRLEQQVAAVQSELAAVRSTAHIDQEAWAQARQELERAASEAQAQLSSVEHALESTTKQLHWAMDALQAQARANADAQALAQRLVETHHAQLAEQMQMHAQREREMVQRLDAQLDELRTRLKVQADQAQAELVAAKAQAKAELQSRELDHGARMQSLEQEASREVAALRSQHEAARADLLRLQRTLARTEFELDAIMQSWSWRLMAPLRSLAQLAGFRPTREMPGVVGRFGTDAGQAVPASRCTSVASARMLDSLQNSTAGHQLAPGTLTPSASEPSIQSSDSSPRMNTLLQEPRRAQTVDELLTFYDEAFVRSAYRTLLDRDADPCGLQHYLSQLRSGIAKQRIIAQIALSPEGRRHALDLPGLKRTVKAHGGRSLIAGLLRRLNMGSDGHVQRHLRMIENRLFAIEQRIALQSTQINQLLDRRWAEPQPQVLAATVAPDSGAAQATPNPTALPPHDARTAKIYSKLKAAISAHTRKAA